MNTDVTNITPETSTPRPLGFWLKATDRLLAAEFARGFEAEGGGRRTWRLLNAVDGTVPSRRPLTAGRLRSLFERGWVASTGDGFTLTDEGRAAKERLGEVVSGIRSRVTGAVSAEDLATTLATLEQISRAFGWSEEAGMPRAMRGRRGRRGFDRGGHGSGRGSADGHRGFGGRGVAAASDSPFGPERGRRGGRRGGHPAMKIAGFGQRSYERGFEAGFAHGRDA